MSPLILHIDETPGLPVGVAGALRADGCDIHHTADPEEAMRWVEERQPALVVMEIELESCEGLHLLAGIRASQGGSVPVLVVTRLPRDTAIHGEAIALGVVDFLTRPVSDRQLLHAIYEVLMPGRETAPRQAASVPDLSGELSDTPIPEVLARLRRRGASGVLAVVHGGARVGVQLRNGSPVGVSSSRGELAAESVFFETFRWEEGHFAFTERQSLGSESMLALEDDPAKLLLHGVLEASPPRQVRERLAKRESLYASFIGGSDSVLDAAGVRLTREQRELLEGLGSADTLSVVLDSPAFGERLVYALWVAGWLELQTQPTLTLTELLGDTAETDAEPEPLPRPAPEPKPERQAPEPPDAHEHEQELAALRRTRERRRRELEALARKRQEREEELEGLARAREERARELEALARKRQEREEELEGLARAREERARELKELAGARKRQARELEELAQAREERARELDALAPALDEGAQELEALARKREQREQELEALARAREESERQLQQLAPELEEHARELQGLRRAREARAEELAELARAREELVQELAELAPALEAHARELEELRRAREERTRELEELAQARDESARELEELERMREERVQELAELARKRRQRARALQEIAPSPEEAQAPEPVAEPQTQEVPAAEAEAEPQRGEIAPFVAPDSADPETLSRTLRALARRVLARDDFAVLGIAASASDGEVRAAYESLVEQIPEIEPTAANLVYAQRAKRIRDRVEAAFANLCDEEKRRAYSLMRAEEEQDRKAKPSAERALEGESWFRKGKAQLEANNTAAALEAFGMAAHLDPQQGEYASHLGYALYLSNPRDADVQREAMEHVARAIKLSPDSELSYLYLGRILVAKGDASVAKKIFLKALRIKPDLHPATRELRLLEMRERKSKGVLSKILKR